MVSVPENLAAILDGHNDFLTVVSESSAWPILEPDEAARIIMQNLYKIYAFDIDSVTCVPENLAAKLDDFLTVLSAWPILKAPNLTRPKGISLRCKS